MVQKVVLETWKAQENSNRGWRFCIYWISHFFLFFWSAEKSICDFAAKIKHTHAYFQCVDDEVYTFTNPVLTIWPDAESYKYKYLQLFPNSRQRNKNTEMEIHYAYKPQLLCWRHSHVSPRTLFCFFVFFDEWCSALLCICLSWHWRSDASRTVLTSPWKFEVFLKTFFLT